MRARLILGVLALPGLPALAADDPAWDRAMLARIEWGIICAEDSGERAEAPGTIAGFIDLYAGEAIVMRQTQRIPTVPGLSFGVVVWASPDDVAGVDITVTHPPMQPSGITEQRWTSVFSANASAANFFSFDLPEERVPGTWRMVARQDGRVVYDVAFDVVDADQTPGAANPCPGPPQIS